MGFNPNVRKIPFVGGTVYKIGQVYDIVNTPCSADPWLWVYGFWHEVPMIFFMLYLPTPVDMVTERFGSPHHRKRRLKGKVMDAWEADIKPGKGLGWAAWKGIRFTEKVGWYLLIADTAATFALNWTSQVYQWAGCNDPNHPFCAFRQDYFVEEFSHDDYIGYGLELQGWKTIRPGSVSSIVIPAGMPASVTYNITSRGDRYFSKEPISVRVVDVGTGRVYFEQTSKRTEEREQTTGGAGRLPFTADYDRVIQLQWKGSDPHGLYNLGNAVFAAYGGDEIEGLWPTVPEKYAWKNVYDDYFGDKKGG